MLKWSEPDLTEFFGVVSKFHDDALSHSYEVSRDGLRLLVTLFEFENAVYISIFREGLPDLNRVHGFFENDNDVANFRRSFDAGTGLPANLSGFLQAYSQIQGIEQHCLILHPGTGEGKTTCHLCHVVCQRRRHCRLDRFTAAQKDSLCTILRRIDRHKLYRGDTKGGQRAGLHFARCISGLADTRWLNQVCSITQSASELSKLGRNSTMQPMSSRHLHDDSPIP